MLPSPALVTARLRAQARASGEPDAAAAAAAYFGNGGTVEFALDALLCAAGVAAPYVPPRGHAVPHPLEHRDALRSVLLGPAFTRGPHFAQPATKDGPVAGPGAGFFALFAVPSPSPQELKLKLKLKQELTQAEMVAPERMHTAEGDGADGAHADDPRRPSSPYEGYGSVARSLSPSPPPLEPAATPAAATPRSTPPPSQPHYRNSPCAAEYHPSLAPIIGGEGYNYGYESELYGRRAYGLEGYGSPNGGDGYGDDAYGEYGYGSNGYGGGNGYGYGYGGGEAYGYNDGHVHGSSIGRRDLSDEITEITADGIGPLTLDELSMLSNNPSWRPNNTDEARWKRTHLLSPTYGELVEDAPEGDGWSSLLSPGYHPRLRPTDAGPSAGLFGLFAVPNLGEAFCVAARQGSRAAADGTPPPPQKLPRKASLRGESLRSARARALGEPGSGRARSISPPVE